MNDSHTVTNLNIIPAVSAKIRDWSIKLNSNSHTGKIDGCINLFPLTTIWHKSLHWVLSLKIFTGSRTIVTVEEARKKLGSRISHLSDEEIEIALPRLRILAIRILELTVKEKSKLSDNYSVEYNPG